MKKIPLFVKLLAVILTVVIIDLFTSCKNNSVRESLSQAQIDSLQNQIKEITAGNKLVAKNLAIFDTLDYTVFSNQEWTRLHESHAKNIKVNWPDGHFRMGLKKHIADLKAMFVYAPDTRIKQHPIRFGSRNMTCVIGIMNGTFSAPMPIGNGKFIQPTGKSFSLPMCTVGIWKDGVMIEEYLFWDNQSYMNQIGLGK